MILAELQTELSLLGPGKGTSKALRKGGGIVEYRGKLLIDFAHFDYLHLGESRELRKVVQQHLEVEGLSPAAPRLLSGTTAPIESAESAIAKFLGAERAFLFPSRTQAILSAVTAVSNERDIFFIDELLQGPFADAAYLVGADVQTFSSLDALSGLLEKASASRRRFIVLETISPLSGATHELLPYTVLAKRFNADIIVDETYALGIVGPRGAGGGEALIQSTNEPLSRNVLLTLADLSFGVSAGGAAVAGPSVAIDAVVRRSKALGYDAPLPSFFGPLIEKSIELLELAPLARAKVLELSRKLRQSLPPTTLMASPQIASPIVSLQTSKYRKAEELATNLFQRGFLVDALPGSTQFSDAAIVRFVVNGTHTERHIEDVQRALSEILSKVEAR